VSRDITACVIIIGNEILSGRTQDLNLAFIGQRCDELGIQLNETRVIPDVMATIVSTVNECRAKFTYVFTTGGIGPTHDDITSAAIAEAFGKKIIRSDEAVAAMDDYYDSNSGTLTEARLKMADVPEDVVLIDNPVSGAPGFQIENVFVLAGVPGIMRAMFDGITNKLIGGAPILTDYVVTNLGESAIAVDLGRLQDVYADVSIGSYPYFKEGKFGVNLALRSTDADRLAELKAELKKVIMGLRGRIIE
jgi:molybdenum cofactor synthesis domain-containing protein